MQLYPSLDQQQQMDLGLREALAARSQLYSSSSGGAAVA
jgi:hypothetical protein